MSEEKPTQHELLEWWTGDINPLQRDVQVKLIAKEYQRQYPEADVSHILEHKGEMYEQINAPLPKQKWHQRIEFQLPAILLGGVGGAALVLFLLLELLRWLGVPGV